LFLLINFSKINYPAVSCGEIKTSTLRAPFKRVYAEHFALLRINSVEMLRINSITEFL
jgi:hypothetical protein